jgi:hypothetical protein
MHPDDAMALRRLRQDAAQITANQATEYAQAEEPPLKNVSLG